MTSDKSRSTEARLNTMIPYAYSTLNTHTTQITTANTNITGLNSRLGSNAQQTFLGSLAQATAPSNPAHSGIGTVGHIGGAPTQSDFNNLVDDFNAANTCINNLVDTVATLISRLDGTNIIH